VPCPVFVLGFDWAPCRWFLLLGLMGIAFIERRLSLLILFTATSSGGKLISILIFQQIAIEKCIAAESYYNIIFPVLYTSSFEV
jgi:hypothetical protein